MARAAEWGHACPLQRRGYPAEVLVQRFSVGGRDYDRHDYICPYAAPLAAFPTHSRINSGAAQTRTVAAEHPFDRSVVIRQSECDAQQEYFSDGITDDLISDLSRVPKLFVIARTLSFTYKGRAEKMQTIGRELGVKYLLEGSARRAGDRVGINVQLVDVAGGTEVWSQRYDRQMHDIFKLQDEIVEGLTTTVGLELPMLEKGIVVPQRTNNIQSV